MIKVKYKFIKSVCLVSLCMMALVSQAQELNCSVEINVDQIEGTNRSRFETLQEAVTEYMNTTVFTPAQFAPNEKIECRLFFTIKELEGDVAKGDLQIQSSRPVYNSSYTTTLLNFKDTKIDFSYQEGEPLNFNLSNWENQLTGILNFYAYLILAIDFDSFSPHGGDPYWDKVAQIVQMGQSSGEVGWKAFEDTKNRSAVSAAFTDASTSGIRDLYYQYHRRGLDEMSTAPDKGRAGVTESLSSLQKIYDASPMSVALSIFKDTKMDELVNVYSKAPSEERTRVYNLLQGIYPTEQSRLEQIKNGSENTNR